MSAARQARALVNLALAAGGPGNGPLRTHILPAHANGNGMRDAGVRGDNFDEILEHIENGQTRAVLALRDNPLMSTPGQARTRAALEKLDLLVLIDEVLTDTAKLAHYVLPDVSVWGKDGTLVSADRRLMRQTAAVAPIDEARPAWLTLTQLGAKLLGASQANGGSGAWGWRTAEAVMEAMAADEELGGLFAEGPYCENSSGVRQPAAHPPRVQLIEPALPAVTALDETGTQLRVFTHRGQFTSLEAAELHDPEADRLHRDDWALIHRLDAGRLGLADLDVVEVSGAAGSLTIGLRVSEDVLPGTIYLPLLYDGGAVTAVLPPRWEDVLNARVSVRATGERRRLADPVAQRQPEASGERIIPLDSIMSGVLPRA